MILQGIKNIKKEDIFQGRTFSRQIGGKDESLLHRGNNDKIISFSINAFFSNLDIVNLNILSNYGVT